MAFELKEGQGSLFKNERKTSDDHPNLTGSIKIGGREYWLSAWTKQSDGKGKWLSISANPKDARGGQGGDAF